MIQPSLQSVPIIDIRPTQMCVGLFEVRKKRKQWQDEGRKKADFLGRHMIPVVLGPKKRFYNIDHHHLMRALHDEGVEDVLVNVIAKLDHLEKDAFWFVLDIHNWVFPWNAKGQRCDYSDIPKTVADLTDDIWRSLAGELQAIGGYAKETVSFSEFVWADYLRRNMKLKEVENDFNGSLKEAVKLAKSKDASYLPGWCGPK